MTDMQALIVELVEKVALVRRDLANKGDLEKYAARFARVDQKVRDLAAVVSTTDPAAADALVKAWDTPARSLAQRNADHQKEDRG